MLKKTITIAIALAFIINLQAKDNEQKKKLTVSEIIDKANLVSYYPGKDGKAKVEMTIVSANGKKRVRKFTILRKNIKLGGDQKFYVYFSYPSDIRKMAYLVWKNSDNKKDDDRWLWLPDLNLKKRIAPGDKRTSFVGSDFLYEDVSGRALNEDKHELIKTTDKHYVIKNIPQKPKDVKFSHYTVWINKKNFMPEKAEYSDKNSGKIYRRVEVLESKEIQGHTTAIKSKASDLVNGTYTINAFSKVKYDIGLKERIFTERFLRRPPREIK